tara:strand:+ start:2003 stop:2152 length:150 start_codon:yes stop_codon:yes gene_type:complete
MIPPKVSPIGPVCEKSNLGVNALETNNAGAINENIRRNAAIPKIHRTIS